MIRALVLTVCLTSLLATGVFAQQAKPIPNLKGVWEGTGEMHFKEHGHMKLLDKVTKLEVLTQEGRSISGVLTWTNKAPGRDDFSGVIDKDGVTFYLAGHKDGIRIGKLDGPDSITLYVLAPGGAQPRAGFAEYKRVK